MKNTIKFLTAASIAVALSQIMAGSYLRMRRSMSRFGLILALIMVLSVQGHAQNRTRNSKQEFSIRPYTVTDFRTMVSTTLTSLHGAYVPLQGNNIMVAKIVPEYRFSFIGMRFNPSSYLSHSAGLEVAFSLLPIGVNGTAGTLSAGISWISDNKSNNQWRYSSTSSFGYMGAYHHIVDSGDKSVNANSHGLYYNKGFSLLRQIGANYSVGMNIGLNLFYLWDWKISAPIDLQYGKRVGFGLYPTVGIVFNYSHL